MVDSMHINFVNVTDQVREMKSRKSPSEIFIFLSGQYPEDQILRAFQAVADETREEARELNRQSDGFSGLLYQLNPDDDAEEMVPRGATLQQAMEIRAKYGVGLAIEFLALQSAKRLEHALWLAAMEADPRWVKEDVGPGEGFTFHQPGDAPSYSEMIDWFKSTHPDEARRIEAENA